MIGLPSLQAMDRAQRARIWMASEATDMRCGFDRLAERVRALIGENPQSGHIVRVSFETRRSIEDSGVEPRRLCTVVQAPGSWSFQNTASRAGRAIGGVARQ